MNSNGRPKGPEKVVVKMRLLPEVAKAVEAWYEAEGKGGGDFKIPRTSATPESGSAALVSQIETLGSELTKAHEEIRSLKKAAVTPKQAVDANDLRDSNNKLLDEVARLQAESENWQKRFNEACDAFPDKQAQYWRAMFGKLKKEVEAKHGSFEFAQ